MDQSVGGALAEVIEAGQRLIVDRIDLAVVEGREAVNSGVLAVGLMALGCLLFIFAWTALNLLLFDLLTGFVLMRAVAFGSCLLLNAGGGAALLLAGWKRHTSNASDKEPS